MFAKIMGLLVKPKQESLYSLLNVSDYEDNIKANKLKKLINTIDECNSNDFNYVVSELLQKMGYSTQIIDGKNDKGIDIICFKGDKRLIAVQCKAWNPKRNTEQIKKETVQSFKGATTKDYQCSLFFTTHYFTDPALEVADDSIILIDRKKFFALLAKYFPEAMADSYYEYSIADLCGCTQCRHGKLIKLFSTNSHKYYHWCESCGERIYNL